MALGGPAGAPGGAPGGLRRSLPASATLRACDQRFKHLPNPYDRPQLWHKRAKPRQQQAEKTDCTARRANNAKAAWKTTPSHAAGAQGACGHRDAGCRRHSSLPVPRPAASPGWGFRLFESKPLTGRKTHRSKTNKQNAGSQVLRVEMSRILISGKLSRKKMEQAQILADTEHPPFGSASARFV